MITPQELQEKCFSKAFMGGYDMGEVDDFLDSLTEDYTALYKENALLKSKMKVLVDKVEEYRASEESMKQAIQSAQSMAEEIVEDARRKSEAMVQPGKSPESPESAELEAIRREIEIEKSRLNEAKRQTAEFVSEMKAVLRVEAELLSGIKNLPTVPPAERQQKAAPAAAPVPAAQPPQGGYPTQAAMPVQPASFMAAKPTVPAAQPVSDPVQDTVRAIEDNVSKIISGTPEPLSTPAFAPASPPATAAPGSPAMAAFPNLDDTIVSEPKQPGAMPPLFEKDTQSDMQPNAELSADDLIAEIQRETAELFKEPEFPEKPKRAIDPALEETRPKFNFTNLQFGKDYEIK